MSEQPARQRLELLCQTGIAPVINALTAGTERAHARLIWSNTGYLMHWFLGELRPQLGDEAWQALRHALFWNRTSAIAPIIRCFAALSHATVC
ncbi:IucA/IucC family C-terminal-domain containing protein [Apirhabdus apintestini]|nr:IucA/IucC family C-terminal-domain containing protein [Enterobacteriaceae bacterium CA-0114]